MTVSAFELLSALPDEYREPPLTRGECPSTAVTPCPFVTCVHNLASDQLAKGRYRLRIIPAGAPSCTLDVATLGPLIRDDVALAMGVTKTYVQIIEETALLKLQKKARGLR